MRLQPGLVMPGGVVPFSSSLKTYAQFLSHISAKESPSTVAWNSPPAAAGTVITTGASDTGIMYATPWGSSFWTSSAIGRAVRHAVSSQAQADAIISNTRAVWLRLTSAGSVDPLVGIDRNGYLSLSESDGIADPCYFCTEIIWWDETSGARTRNPSTSSAETAYIF